MKFDKVIKVRVTLMEEMLGMSPPNPDIYDEYIASNAPDAKSIQEEIAAVGVETAIKNGTTIFPKDENGIPFLWDYQIKGFFKDSCSALQKSKGAECAKYSGQIKAFKKIVDGCIFPRPRKILIDTHGVPLGQCQRSLRTSGAAGEQTTLARSETAPAGSTIEFEVGLTSKNYADAVREWMDYGELKGFGQWRNSGKGRFLWEELDENGNVIGGNIAMGD